MYHSHLSRCAGREEFDQRFDWTLHSQAGKSLGAAETTLTGAAMEVEKYMEYMGQRFADARYDPCCYLLQSRSMDLMNVGFGSTFAEGVLRIQAERVFACGIKQDELIPAQELKNFAELLSSRDTPGSVVYDEMSSLYGHDAFFKELGWLVRPSPLSPPANLSVIAPGQGPRLRELLEGGLEKELESEERMKPMLAI